MNAKAHPYVVNATVAGLPVTLAEARSQIKFGTDADADVDAFLTLAITTALAAAERYTKRDFLTKTYYTYRDRFGGDIVLRRNPLQSVTSVQYLKSGALTVVSAALYYVTVEPDGFARIALLDGCTWPGDADVRDQVVRVEFKCGYGDAEANLPAALRMGILAHVAYLWTHRGDNDFAGSGGNMAAGDNKVPACARVYYDQYRLLDIT